MKESSFVKQWLQESLEQGIERGFEQGIEQGVEQGKQAQQRATILDILAQRFNPSAQRYLRIIKQLEMISDLERLRELLLYAALQAADIADFEQVLAASPEHVAARAG